MKPRQAPERAEPMATPRRDGKPTLIIVEDNAIFRYALETTLAQDYDILALAGDGAAGVAAVDQHQPGIVLMDISCPL